MIGAPPATIVTFHCRPTPSIASHNGTHGDELADPLSLLVDVEGFTAVKRTRPRVPKIGSRTSVPGAGGLIGRVGDLTVSEW
jgi:hypothetical protein